MKEAKKKGCPMRFSLWLLLILGVIIGATVHWLRVVHDGGVALSVPCIFVGVSCPPPARWEGFFAPGYGHYFVPAMERHLRMVRLGRDPFCVSFLYFFARAATMGSRLLLMSRENL